MNNRGNWEAIKEALHELEERAAALFATKEPEQEVVAEDVELDGEWASMSDLADSLTHDQVEGLVAVLNTDGRSRTTMYQAILCQPESEVPVPHELARIALTLMAATVDQSMGDPKELYMLAAQAKESLGALLDDHPLHDDEDEK